MQINQSARAFASNQLERAVEHALAIAKRSTENVSRKAMRVHAHHHRTSSAFHVSLDQGNVRLSVELVLKSDHAEFTVTRWQHRFTHADYVTLILHAIANQLRDGQHLELMLAAERHQIRHAGHGAIFIHDLADHARGTKARETREINGSFGLSGANEHAAFARAEGE